MLGFPLLLCVRSYGDASVVERACTRTVFSGSIFRLDTHRGFYMAINNYCNKGKIFTQVFGNYNINIQPNIIALSAG